jgi:hypothetical protein
MTKQELNRDIKKLAAEIYRMSFEDLVPYFKYIEDVAKPEFIRLFKADDEFKNVTLSSLKIMLRLNVKHRFVPFHTFGLNIKLQNEI